MHKPHVVSTQNTEPHMEPHFHSFLLFSFPLLKSILLHYGLTKTKQTQSTKPPNHSVHLATKTPTT